MTTTAAATTAPPRSERPARFGLTALAVIAPIGPLAVAGIRALLPYQTTDDAAGIVAGVAADPGAQDTVVMLGVVASLTLIVGVLVVSMAAIRTAPILGTVGAVLAFLGFASVSTGPAAIDLAALAAVRTGIGDPAAARLVEEMAAHPGTAVATGLFVFGHIVGTVLLGIALWRMVPRWAAVALIVSQPLHLVFAVIMPNGWLDAAAWTLTAIGFAAAGVAFRRMR
ncbi:MAG TPA: hypothetical protein VM677_21845 [Actinokineospora sp.]|nr:hypothetical protein [Actinokineospora sp.]